MADNSSSPNVSGMVADPDFQSLSPADKRAALGKLTGDSSFSGLSDAETMQFVSKLTPNPTEAQMAQQMTQRAQQQAQAAPGQVKMTPSWWGGMYGSPQQEAKIDQLIPQVQGRVSDIRKGALSAAGASIGAGAGELAAGLPAGIRALAGASGAGAGAGIGNLVAGGSPKEALQTAAQTTAVSAPITGAATAAEPLLNAGANAKSAGQALNAVESVIGKHTMDVEGVAKVASRAQEINKLSRAPLPGPIRGFIQRLADDEKGPLTFSEGRTIYKAATKMSSDEYTRLNGPMKAQMSEFTKELGNSLNEAAARGGKYEQYRAGMKSYSQAASASNTKDAIKDAVLKKILPGVGIAGAEWAILKNVIGAK
jgi:hypothetical protein